MSHSRKDISARQFKRILIIKPSSLGDVVHALPVLNGLRARYPQALIHWMVAPPFASILEERSQLDGIVLFDRRRFGRMIRSPRVVGEFISFLRELRASRYDLVVDLQGLFRTGFIAWATGARVRVGLGNAREGAWLFYSHRTKNDGMDCHAVDRNYAVAGLLGFTDRRIAFSLTIPPKLRDEIKRILLDKQMGESQRLVAVVPGTRWETKKWAPERFAKAIDALQEKGVRCVLVGGADEVVLCTRIERLCESPPINLAGHTSIRQMAALVDLADVTLCHDSAAMHLAVALERPVVCLIGPTNPTRTGPYRRPEDVVRLDLSCAPCYLRKLSQCPHQHKCMNDLDVATVVSAVERALASTSFARA